MTTYSLWHLSATDIPFKTQMHYLLSHACHMLSPSRPPLRDHPSPLTPNVNYSGRTAPLTSKVAFYIFIQQI